MARERRRRGTGWPNQFEVEPISVYRQKEGQRTVDLIQTAWKDKGLPPLPTHGAASPLPPPRDLREAAERFKRGAKTAIAPQPAPKPQQTPYVDSLRDPRYDIPGMEKRSGFGSRTQFPSSPKPKPPEGLRGLLADAGGVLGAGFEQYDKLRKYGGGPVFSTLTGTTGVEPKFDPETGQTYRGGANMSEWGAGLKELFTRSPIESYREGVRATEERLRDPELSLADSILIQGFSDPGILATRGSLMPLRFLGAGLKASRVPGAIRAVTAAERAAEAARVLGQEHRTLRWGANLLENPGEATIAGVGGAAAAAEYGEQVPGFNRIPEEWQPIVGGLVGGVSPSVVRGAPGTIRGIPEAVQRAQARAKAAAPGIKQAAKQGMLMPATTALGITGTPVWPDVVANQQQEAFRAIETIDPATEPVTGPNRGARGPVGPPLSQAETEIDRVLETYRNPDTGELEMSIDDLGAAYTAASPKGKKKPGSLPWMSVEEIRLAFEVGMKGSNWYRTFATWLNDLTGGKLDESLFDFAVGSQQAKPSVNMIKAFNAMRLVNDLTQGGTIPISAIPDFEAQLIAAIGKGTKQGMSTDQVEKIAEGYTTGRSGTTSPGAAKTPYYNQSLIAAFMNRFMPGAVVDTHMGKPLAFGNSKRGGKEGFGGSAQPKGDYEYQFANRLFQHLASEYGINVGQFQAGAWETIKKVAEDPELVRQINAGEIEWGEAFARTPDATATGGFQESFHNDKKVKAAYAALMDSFQKFPPVGERDIQFGFDNPKQSVRDAGFSVGSEQTARIQEAVRQKSPILNFSAKPGGTPNLPMDSWTAGQKAFLSSIGYDPATRQFKPLADAGIPHEVELEGFGTWGEDIAAPEPNVRVRLPGANAAKAEFVADWLGRELEAAGAKQDAIAIGLPNSQVNTFRGMRIPARAGQFAGPEADNLAAVSSKYGLWPTQSHDGEFIEFNDYRFPGVGKEAYAGQADSFLTRVDLALDELGYSREWVQAHAGDSYLVSAGKDAAGNPRAYGDLVAREGGLYDPDEALGPTVAGVGAVAGPGAPPQVGTGAAAQVPVPSQGVKSLISRAASRALAGIDAPKAGITRTLEPGDLAYHGTPNPDFEGMPAVGNKGANSQGQSGPYYTPDPDYAEGFLQEGAPGGRIFEATPTGETPLLVLNGSVTPDEFQRLMTAIDEVLPNAIGPQGREDMETMFRAGVLTGSSMVDIIRAYSKRSPEVLDQILERAGFRGTSMSDHPLSQFQLGQGDLMEPSWTQRARNLAAKALPEAPAAGITKVAEPGQVFSHGTAVDFEGVPTRGTAGQNALGGEGPYNAIDANEVGVEYANQSARNRTGFGQRVFAQTPKRPLGFLGWNEPVLPEEMSEIFNAVARLHGEDVAEDFGRTVTGRRLVGEQVITHLRRLGSSIMTPNPDGFGRSPGNPNKFVSGVLAEAGWEGIEAVSEGRRIAQVFNPDDLESIWSHRARKLAPEGPTAGVAPEETGLDPRRQRMAKGGVLDLDWANMTADEIARVLGRSDEEVNELWELWRLNREGELGPAGKKDLAARSKVLWAEYKEKYGGLPKRAYTLGTRAENYKGIEAAARARGLDPRTQTNNIAGAYRKAGDAWEGEIEMRAPHERVEGYEPNKPTASQAAAEQAGDIAAGDVPAPRIEKRQREYGELIDERRRVQTAIDRIEARRTPENADQMDRRLAPLQRELEGIETELRAQEVSPDAGAPASITGKGSVGKGVADAFTPFKGTFGVVGAPLGGYASAKLEGEDDETALERMIMLAGVGIAGTAGRRARGGVRAAVRATEDAGEDAAKKRVPWVPPEGTEPPKPRWGNAKTPEELRKRAEQRQVAIENLAKARQAPRKARTPSPKVQADLDAAAEEMGIPPPEAAPLPRPEGNRLRPEGGTPRTTRTPRTGVRPPSEVIAEQIAKLEAAKAPQPTGPGDILRGAERTEGADWRDVGPVPKSVQELRDDPLRRLGEQRAIEQQQGIDELSTPGRVAPAATFPEGPESAATTPLGGDFEPTALEGAGPVDVANPLPRSTPQDELRAEQELAKVGAERRRVEKEHADTLLMETSPSPQGVSAPAAFEDKQLTAEQAIAAIPADDPRLPAIKRMQEAWGEEFKAIETENPKEGVTSGNWANKLLIEWPTAMSRAMFSLATSGDFGSGFIQSQLLFFTDPVAWKRSMTASFHAVASPEFREKQRAFNRARIEAAVPEAMRGEIYETAINGRVTTNADGTTKTGPRLAISTKAAEMSGDFGSPLLERGKYNPVRPYLQAFRRQFETQTEHLRVHAFTEMLEMARQLNIKQGKGDILFPHQVDGAINKANHLTGATSGRLNPVLGVAFGAPRFLLSQFAMIQDFVTPGGGTSTAYARRKMIQGFGTVMTATVAWNVYQSGGKDWFGPGLGGPDDIKNDDDFKRLMTHPNFGRIRVSIPKLGKADVSLFGPLDPMARAFFKEMANLDNILRTGDESVRVGTAGANFLENKASAFPRTILNLTSGEDRFSGREMDSWQDVIAVEAPRIAPIFTQNFEEALNNEGSWTDTIIGYTGHKSSPLSPSEQVDAVMAGLPDKYWVVDAENQDFRPPESIWELSAKDRSEIREEYPAVARYLEKLEQDSDKPFSQKLSGVHKDIQQRWDDKLAQGNGFTTSDWREQFIANQRQLRETRELEDPPEEREATTQRDLDLDAYFGIYDNPAVVDENENVDYTAAEAEMRALRARIGEARWADIEETLGWNESPTVRSYLADMRTYGDFLSTNPKYEGVPQERTRKADSIATKVREVQASAPVSVPSKYILGIWRDQGDITQQEYDDAVIVIGRKYSEEYEEWKTTEEGRRALQWFKPVDLTQGFVIPEGTTFDESTGDGYAGSSSRRSRTRERRGRRGRRTRSAA